MLWLQLNMCLELLIINNLFGSLNEASVNPHPKYSATTAPSGAVWELRALAPIHMDLCHGEQSAQHGWTLGVCRTPCFTGACLWDVISGQGKFQADQGLSIIAGSFRLAP